MLLSLGQEFHRVLFVLDEHLPVFPVEEDYLSGVKRRVTLARLIDKEDHRFVMLGAGHRAQLLVTGPVFTDKGSRKFTLRKGMNDGGCAVQSRESNSAFCCTSNFVISY